MVSSINVIGGIMLEDIKKIFIIMVIAVVIISIIFLIIVGLMNIYFTSTTVYTLKDSKKYLANDYLKSSFQVSLPENMIIDNLNLIKYHNKLTILGKGRIPISEYNNFLELVDKLEIYSPETLGMSESSFREQNKTFIKNLNLILTEKME